MSSSNTSVADNLQASVESWITNLDSLEIFSLDRVLSGVSKIDLRAIDLNNLYTFEPSKSVSELIVSRDPTTGRILDFQEDFKIQIDKDECLHFNFDENKIDIKDLLSEIPSIGRGIEYSEKYIDDLKSNEKRPLANEKSNLIDLSQALYHPTFSLDESTATSTGNQSYLDESNLNESLNETTANISDILTLNENASPSAELFANKRRSESAGGGSSGSRSSTPSIDELVVKRKMKKFAIEADQKLVAQFDEIKSKLAHQWPFELDVFQKQAVYLMENSECVFVAAHTSAGKTVVAEYAIALSFKHKTKVIYTSPIKALSNQKFREFKSIFDDVGLITGDIQIAPESSCLIMTTEILRSMLYRRSETLHDLEWVIFDEVHYMNDAHRGVVWEEVLILLPDHINIVMLSATIPNHNEFAEWVGKIKQRPIYVMSTKKRPVPLEHYLYTGNSNKTSNEFYLLIDANEKFYANNYTKATDVKNERTKGSANKFGPKGTKMSANPAQEKNIWLSLIGMLEQKSLLPVVAFTFSRKRCDDNINLLSSLDLNTASEKSRIHLFIRQSLATLTDEDKNIPQITHLSESLARGIGVHHSGILPIMKEIIELLFQMSLIKVLFATETFAMGINMPARTVVFDSIRKHDGTKFRLLQTSEYIQMAGRAGRRGLDKTGTVIVLCKNEIPDMNDLRDIMQGKAQKLESKFRITYSMILSLMRKKDMRIQDFMRRSFSEHKMTQAESPAVYEAANVYLNDKLEAFRRKARSDAGGVESCVYCGSNSSGTHSRRMMDYYHTCAEYAKLIQELYEKLQVNGVVFKSLTPGRVVFVKSVRYRSDDDKLIEYKLAPVVLLEPMTKDNTHVLALSLGEISLMQSEENDLWEDEHDEKSILKKMVSFYDKVNQEYENLIEKLKNFTTNEVQIPFIMSSLATYRSVKNATLLLIKFTDIQAISTKQFQKNAQVQVDFSFANPIWTQANSAGAGSARTLKFIENLNKELSKNPSFMNLASELFHFVEYYTSLCIENDKSSLFNFNMILDFMKDLNIRDLQFADLFEDYKRILNQLSKLNCLECPKFQEHFDEVQIESSIIDRINYINDVISGNSLLLVSEYRYRIEVLKRLRLIDDKHFVLLKGRVALEISMSELLITELIIENVFSQMQPYEIVSLLSAIVYQQKATQDDENYFKTSFNNAALDQGRDKMLQIAHRLNTIQKECQLQIGNEDDYVEQLNFGLVSVVYEWSRGLSFVKITSLTNVQEGIIVKTIQRLDELCGNLRNAARIIGDTVLESKIEQCSVLIRRDIVFAASLYVKNQ